MWKLLTVLALVGIVLSGVPRLSASIPYQNVQIIGGNPTNISEHPWQIAFEYNLTHFCGGFLISKNWVVTAGHCFQGYDNLSIRAGTSMRNSGGEVILVSKVIVHPNFNLTTVDNDIALVQLSTSVTIPVAKPASLPAYDQDIEDGVEVTVIGWGFTEHLLESNQLLQVKVPSINHQVCERAYAEKNITENMFCAGLLDVGGKDACGGDSGGAAEINGEVAGIVSWGIGCAEPGHPGVYTKVSNYINWIKEHADI